MASITNAEMIFRTRIELAAAGILKTGPEYEDGMEELHTFAHWKSLGFCVRKGEKCLVKIPIYKYATKKVVVNGEEKESGKMFPKVAAFFAARQVEKLEAVTC